MNLTSSIRASNRVPVLQAAKTSLATILAWLTAQLLLPGELPIFAAIAALLVVQPSINQSLGKAAERGLGVIVGVAVAYGVGLLFGTSSWVVLAAIILCILLAWALRLSPGSSNQIPISAMLVLSIGATSPAYAIDRVLETIIGAVIALVINVLVVPPVLLEPARQSVVLLADEVAETLDRVAAALLTPQSAAELDELMIKARLLRPMLNAADKAIEQAEESMTLNPRQGRYRPQLDADEDLRDRLRILVTRALGMTRAFRDHYDDSLHLEPSVQAFSLELGRAAHDLRLLAQQHGTPVATGVSRAPEAPALTAPLTISTPHPRHWILIGSLMEDLRRVREEILGE